MNSKVVAGTEQLVKTCTMSERTGVSLFDTATGNFHVLDGLECTDGCASHQRGGCCLLAGPLGSGPLLCVC